MEIKDFYDVKRLLLFAVFMMLPVLGQYAGAQITLQAVDAGFTDDGKWWVDLKNPSATSVSSTGKKLGICFFIEKSGGQTTTDNGTTMRWNDAANWSILAGETVRFTETGGRDNNMDGLTKGLTYYLNIKIQDNPDADITSQVNVSWANATFVYQGKTDGVNKISDFTKTAGFTMEEGTGTVIEANKIYNLEKDKIYTFATGNSFATTWGEADSSTGKTFTFGWFDNEGKFLGVTGKYEIKKPTDTGRDYGDKYYDIIPVANASESDLTKKYKHLEYNADGKSLKLDGAGALYIGGSKSGFGVPEPDGTYGWNAGNDENNKEIKGSAIPQIANGVYQFDITTGNQAKAWGKTGEALLFKVFHYKRWDLPIDDEKTCGNFEFKRKPSVDETFSYSGTTYNQTFYHIEKDVTKSPLGGMFEVTNSSDPSLGNGNIHGLAIGQDSDLPKFPNGYTFRFDLDLTANAWDFPLCVSLKSRPDDASVDDSGDWHASDFTNKTGNVGEITVRLSDNAGNKRISLRDALRLDWNIPYANSNPKDAKTDNVVKIDKIIVKGRMSVDDIYYLGDMVSISKITNIDLTDAIIENNQIPATFAGNITDNGLESIILPKYGLDENGEKTPVNIGAYAFAECKALKTVTFTNDAHIMIGAGAFKNCEKLTNATIQSIINHSYATLRESVFEGTSASDIKITDKTVLIDKNAFKDTPLKRLTLPAKCTGNKSELVPYTNWILPGAIGSVFVKGSDGALSVDEARQNRTLDGTKTSISIEAEDFNQEYGSGWFNNGDNSSTGAFDTDYRSDFKEDTHNFAIVSEAGGRKLGYMKPYYWFKYSFRVADDAAGAYKLSAWISSGSDGEKHPEFAIDGGSDKIRMTLNKTDWNPWNHEEPVGYVSLESGIHYITYYGDKDTDLDKLVIEKVDESVTPTITPGPYTGKVVTEYRLVESDEKVSILSSDEEAFSGVEANNCEVVFPEGTTAEMIKGYRNEGTEGYAVDNSGIRNLLTKTVSEDSPYNVVYQEHADVKAVRTFNKKQWNSVVFPFTVTGKILKNATDNAGTLAEPFKRAAYLFDNNYGVPGYDVKMRFVYLDNQKTFDENGTGEIKAGTPFLLFVDGSKASPSDNVYVFKDITTPAASTTVGMGYDAAKVLTMTDPAGEKGITDYSFDGKLKYKTGDAAFTNKIYWVADSKYYWGTNVTMKNMRSWFTPKTPAGARAIESLFGFIGDDTTGIGIVESDADNSTDKGIYSVCGKLISTDKASLSRLPKGVYIVNGKKVVVK